MGLAGHGSAARAGLHPGWTADALSVHHQPSAEPTTSPGDLARLGAPTLAQRVKWGIQDSEVRSLRRDSRRRAMSEAPSPLASNQSA